MAAGRTVSRRSRGVGRRRLPSVPTNPAGLISFAPDRKSTRLNSSHPSISYAVFCLKKKKLHRNSLRFYLSPPGALSDEQRALAATILSHDTQHHDKDCLHLSAHCNTHSTPAISTLS